MHDNAKFVETILFFNNYFLITRFFLTVRANLAKHGLTYSLVIGKLAISPLDGSSNKIFVFVVDQTFTINHLSYTKMLMSMYKFRA